MNKMNELILSSNIKNNNNERNIVGRWIWKNGILKENNIIPWNIEIVNTNTLNLKYNKDKTILTVLTPGLYELVAGFFTESEKPKISFIINNKLTINSIIRKENRERYNNNIIGWSLIEFISIPCESTISIQYEGKLDVQAFWGLKKL